jgi:glycine betaine/proline transport system substrate-binding protein
MATTGQPAVVPELWVTRIAQVWNEAMAARSVRPAANTYDSQVFEAWYIPQYVAAAQPDLTSAAALAATPLVPATAAEGAATKPRFISCPLDWGCSLINRNLIAAHGLTDAFEIVEPANRIEMDQLIAGAVSRREPFVAYYWQPNAILDQFGFVALDMGETDTEALQCLARSDCADPQPSAFAGETVVVALAEWVFLDVPQVAAYFQRAVMPLSEMNTLLSDLNQPGATPETVAEQFIAEREDVWRAWVGSGTP